jgi:hypothetical protein
MPTATLYVTGALLRRHPGGLLHPTHVRMLPDHHLSRERRLRVRERQRRRMFVRLNRGGRDRDGDGDDA